MLSRNAFNALLKTLEEPPESVKFVFATTEIRKVPVTVLSRCQRFDLRRVETDRMADHLKMIADKEAIHIEDAALKRLARAAEGSVRDALSLLDQAAALTSNQIEDNAVAAMLGQAGRMDAIQIVKAALMGQADQAMAGLDNAIKSGAEAIMIIADMLDYIHMASRIAAGGSITDLPESEQAELDHMAKDITLSRLARAWQIMLKGHGEVNLAPDPHAAADMVLIRLAHVANMPTPGDLVKKLKDVTPDMLASSTPASSAPTSSAPVSSTLAEQLADQDMPPPMADMPDHMADHMAPAPSAPSSPQLASPQLASPQLASPQLASPQPVPENMIQMAQIFEDHGELKLASYLRTRIRPVLLEAGRFEFSADRPLDESVPGQIGYFLTEWTGMRWMVSVATQSGSDTLDEIEHAQKQAIRDSLAADPIVKSAMDTFPDSTIHSITPLTGMVTLTDDPADLSDAESSDDDEKKADHA